MTITEEIQQKAEKLASSRGFANANEYMLELLTTEEHDADMFAGQEEAIIAAIQLGFDSGPSTPMTSENWQALQERIRNLPGGDG